MDGKKPAVIVNWSVVCFTAFCTMPNPTHRQLMVYVAQLNDQLVTSGGIFTKAKICTVFFK